jgi:Domain of unknown function (DUF1851)
MPTELFRLLDPPRSVEDLGCWSAVTSQFSLVVGFTAFGNFFLRNPATGQYAVLYTIGPELVPTNFQSSENFQSAFLSDEGIIRHLGRPSDVAALESRLGSLAPNQVYFPVPYPFLGGSGELDTFDKGDVWVFADLVGQSQGVG